MRITIVGAHYAPEPSGNAPYTTGLAEGLAEIGHHVTVVSGFPHYPDWKLPPDVPRTARETLRGVHIRRLRTYVPVKPTAIRRLAYEMHFGIRSGFSRLYSPDVVVLICPLMFASRIALVLFRLRGVRAARGVIMQDIYSRGVAETGLGGARVVSAVRKIEGSLVRNVDGVSVIHDRFKSELTDSLKCPPNRVTVIRNWTHVDEPAPFDVSAYRRSLGWRDDEIVVLHAGAMGLKQDLGNVIEAANVAALRSAPVRFVLVGGGGERARLEALAVGVDKVQMLGSLNDEDFKRVHRAADILLVNERAGVAEMSVPSKLTTYFAAGRPVLASTGPTGATAFEIENSGAGICVSAGSPEQLLDAVLQIAADREGSARMGAAGRRYAADVLSHSAAMRKYDEWLRRLANAPLSKEARRG